MQLQCLGIDSFIELVQDRCRKVPIEKNEYRFPSNPRENIYAYTATLALNCMVNIIIRMIIIIVLRHVLNAYSFSGASFRRLIEPGHLRTSM